MSWVYLRDSFRRRREAMEQRLAEVRHRLVVERACGKAVYGGAAVDGAASVPGLLEMEELLDEAAVLEQALQRKTTY